MAVNACWETVWAQKDPEVSILTTENELGQLTLPLKSLGLFFCFLFFACDRG